MSDNYDEAKELRDELNGALSAWAECRAERDAALAKVAAMDICENFLNDPRRKLEQELTSVYADLAERDSVIATFEEKHLRIMDKLDHLLEVEKQRDEALARIKRALKVLGEDTESEGAAELTVRILRGEI